MRTAWYWLALYVEVWYNVAVMKIHTALPETDVLAIEQSEHKVEIHGLLCSGVSPARVTVLMQQKYSEALTIQDVSLFAAAIPEGSYLKPGELQRRVGFIDVEIDIFGEMAAALRYMKSELEVSMIATRVTNGDGTTMQDTRKLMNQYWRMLSQYGELQKEMGIVVPASPEPAPPPETKLPSLREIMTPTVNIAVAIVPPRPEALQPEIIDVTVKTDAIITDGS